MRTNLNLPLSLLMLLGAFVTGGVMVQEVIIRHPVPVYIVDAPTLGASPTNAVLDELFATQTAIYLTPTQERTGGHVDFLGTPTPQLTCYRVVATLGVNARSEPSVQGERVGLFQYGVVLRVDESQTVAGSDYVWRRVVGVQSWAGNFPATRAIPSWVGTALLQVGC